MLAPPSSSKSLAEALAPTGGPMKARGFQQSTPRVQQKRNGGADDSSAADGLALWTETPQQRMDRMKGEVMGTASSASGAAQDGDEAQREAYMARLRDEELKRQVEQARGESSGVKTKTLLEQHEEKRRKEYKERSSGSGSRRRDDEGDDRDNESRRGSSSRHDDRRSSKDDRDRDRHRHRRHDDDDHRRGRRDDDDDDDSRHRSDDKHRRHRHHHHRRHRSRSRSRSRSPSSRSKRDDRDRHRDRKSHRSSHHRSSPSPPAPPRRKTGAEKEKEAEEMKERPSTMIWDREKAMSFIPLMDQGKRQRTMADAKNGLGDRFGGSSAGSRFL